MNFIKKINKGILLTIIVLIILLSYIIVTEIQRNNEKGIIKEVCEKYIDFENSYTVLPLEKRNTESLEEIKSQMANKLKEIMVDNDKIYEQQKSIVSKKLDEQLKSFELLLNKESKGIKITNYIFDGDQVVVAVENTLETETKMLDFDYTLNENAKSNKSTEKYEDTITLKRENGTWKIVFADIETNFAEGGFIF